MSRHLDLGLTALAPVVWGSTYLVATEWLPQGYPITVAALRALPAGLLLLLAVRRLPGAAWLSRLFVLGALNIALFWTLLFVAAYRLPGGVAATLGSTQALLVVLLARTLLGTPIRLPAIVAALGGVVGVGLLLLTPTTGLDPVGVAAGLGAAASMAAGTVLSRRWQPPVPPLAFTAWQLTAGGVLLLPLAVLLEPALPELRVQHAAGLTYLSLIGAALTYFLWFRGISRLEPTSASLLAMLSPVTAVVLGWGVLNQALSPIQTLGAAVVLLSVWFGQRASRRLPSATGPAGITWRMGRRRSA